MIRTIKLTIEGDLGVETSFITKDYETCSNELNDAVEEAIGYAVEDLDINESSVTDWQITGQEVY